MKPSSLGGIVRSMVPGVARCTLIGKDLYEMEVELQSCWMDTRPWPCTWPAGQFVYCSRDEGSGTCKCDRFSPDLDQPDLMFVDLEVFSSHPAGRS
ncbi:hypothetical protein RRG08_037618 [Elysia crispata]|uniref:Uncharacterized protein n=1 Tax=Elysia crispata TaxID=231223 RepID=A0AAE0YGT4_9GAST|nr:hypothetical protein RRG08_037618 [Elysia crispata]